MKLVLSLLLLVAGGCTAVFAQSATTPDKVDPFIRACNAKRERNPKGLLFTLRSKDNRKQFYQGEVITLELSFASSKPGAFTLDAATYDRSGRVPSDDFILDRRDGVVDPLDDYFNSGLHGFIGGGLRSVPELTDKPYVVTVELNEWLRFDKSGPYRLYVVSNRVGRKGAPATYLSNDGRTVVSNVIEFEILPVDKKWANQKLNEAIAALSKPGGDRRPACRAMRFLGTTAAASEMRKRFRGDDEYCEWEYKAGLIGSPHRAFVIRDMENALSSPEQPLTSTFLSTLALLEFTRQTPPAPVYPNGTDEQNKHWQSQMERRRKSYDHLRLNYLRQLMMVLPQKQGQARATSLQTLLDHQAELSPSEFSQWSTLLGSMPEVFNRLPLDQQVRLLQYQWKPIASDAMLPVLRAILNEPDNKTNPYGQQELRSIALRRLYELSPEEGRRLILEEIRRPKPRVDGNALRSLPDETLPELDAVLAANLEQAHGPNGSGDTEAISELIERYATAEILPQVRAIYEGPGHGRWACRIQAALLAYLLRVDPTTGGDYLNKALAARDKEMSRCYASTLTDVARLHLSAEVEAAAIAVLDDEDSEVVSQAAAVLSEHGSADAENALWLRLQKWHEAMQSRSEELSTQTPGVPAFGAHPLSGQAMIENSLRNALARGRAWLADPEKLRRLRELCHTRDGRDEIDRLIHGWGPGIFVAFSSLDDERSSMSVAHYQLSSLAALKQKLLQFPKGTIFRWQTPSSPGTAAKAQELFDQLRTYLEDHGMKLAAVADERR